VASRPAPHAVSVIGVAGALPTADLVVGRIPVKGEQCILCSLSRLYFSAVDKIQGLKKLPDIGFWTRRH
jgi:hypothetical protein